MSTVIDAAARDRPTAPARRGRRCGSGSAGASRSSASSSRCVPVPVPDHADRRVQDPQEILKVPPTYLPQDWAPENFVNMWGTPETPLPWNLFSTVVISLGGTALALVAALPAAYYTARHQFRLKLPFLLLVLITQMLQPTVLASGLFREFVTLEINDTRLAMILVNAAFNLSFAVWIMHSFFATVPKEIEEAAWLDGCSRGQSLRRIMLPLCGRASSRR